MPGVHWSLPGSYYLMFSILSGITYLAWWRFASRLHAPGIDVANRALIAAASGQLLYAFWRIAWRLAIGAEVSWNSSLFVTLLCGELVGVSCYVVAVVYGGGELIHYLYIRYAEGTQVARNTFLANMAQLADHPFRPLRTLALLWLVALGNYLFLCLMLIGKPR